MKLRYQAIWIVFLVTSFLLAGWLYFGLPIQYAHDNLQIPDEICDYPDGEENVLFKCEWIGDNRTAVCYDYSDIYCENLAK